jgi:glycerol-3-phosphate acyltransferase PlsX
MNERMIKIALDAMGGVNAPESIINGAALFAQEVKDVYFIIYGNAKACHEHIAKHASLKNCYELVDTNTEVILDTDPPLKALRRGRDSSMYKAIEAVSQDKADACLSGGNTAALMVMAQWVLGVLTGLKKPAIVGVYPNRVGGCVMLDLGANTECEAEHLFQFALMGDVYAKIVLKKHNPSIGVLNIGEEESKGKQLHKQVYAMLKAVENINFYGYVEGNDIMKGTTDVVVTDGFSGNLVLKASEGTAKLCTEFLKEALNSSWTAKIGAYLAQTALKNTFAKIDPRNVNGAMFIGLNGIVVKSHGSSDAIGVKSALGLVYNLAKRSVNTLIMQELMLINKHDNLLSRIKKKLGLGNG